MGHSTFWDYSLATYRLPGVADACLNLQDRLGIDVNLLLYCCWYACSRGTISDTDFSSATSFSTSWSEEVVRPLRAARTWMKHTGCAQDAVAGDDCATLREKIKAAELQAERLQQRALEAATVKAAAMEALPRDVRLAACATNLDRYLGYCGATVDEGALAELSCIVAAGVDAADTKAALAALQPVFQRP